MQALVEFSKKLHTMSPMDQLVGKFLVYPCVYDIFSTEEDEADDEIPVVHIDPTKQLAVANVEAQWRAPLLLLSPKGLCVLCFFPCAFAAMMAKLRPLCIRLTHAHCRAPLQHFS